MKFKSYWFYRLSTFLAAIAIVMVNLGVNTTCTWSGHQPKLPAQAEKFKKYK